ncbi:Ig-like domain-containing protein [Photobacterium atrarenae]|uniref:Ig-like domain-containing protein n=1 Tax=Photobacterium atrarenae TaxID=865757 RepID=A0ABY5GJE3_9GAMM|nr:Ig-like domain-containing protein [Photobacterium atrarenae]UTV29437.1 Ig-like domain-containing protein [Photobacterium atrarenae]
MRKEWGYLLLIAALGGCGGGDSPKTEQPKDDGGEVPASYQMTFSGKVFVKSQTEQQLAVYAGATQLGQGTSQADGTYNITLTLDEQTYHQAQQAPLRVVASAENIQLVALLSSTIQKAAGPITYQANLSSFSTAAYVLADLNQDGEVTLQEWQTYQGASQSDQVNPNLLKLATSLEAVMAEQVPGPADSVLDWLLDLKATAVWDQWLSDHKAVLTSIWSATVTDAELRREGGNYLKGSGKALTDFTAEQVLVKAPTAASCELAIHITDVGVNPHQVAIGRQLQLATEMTDNLTGLVQDVSASWTSHDPKTIRVNAPGGIEAMAAGKVDIEARYQHGKDECRDSMSFTVIDTQNPVPTLTAIEIQGKMQTQVVGESWQLTALGSYDNHTSTDITDEVSWSSSDGIIAVVSNDGVLTTYGGGTATIFARKGEISQQVTVTVDAPAPKVRFSWVEGEFDDFNLGETTEIEVFVEYENNRFAFIDDDLIDWQVGQSGIVSVVNGQITALAEGTVTVTAAWTSYGIPQQVSEQITVLPPVIVSVYPDILGGELTMLEGSVFDRTFTVTYSDQSRVVYDQLTLEAQNDPSGLPVAYLDEDSSIHAMRAGTGTLWIHGVPRDVLDQLPPQMDKQDKIEVALVVKDNPNVYQWHREQSAFRDEQHIVSTQNVLYGGKVYRFSHESTPASGGLPTQVVRLTTFNGEEHQGDTTLLSSTHGMLSNQMIDGGGHGYFLLIMPDTQGVRTYHIYNLTDGSIRTVDLTGAPQSLLTTGETIQPFGFTADGHLMVLDNTDARRYQVYLYRPQDDQPGNWKWVTGETVVGEGLRFIQLPSYDEHLVLMAQGGSEHAAAPKYHFINRASGQVESVAQLRYPDSATNIHCGEVALLPGASIAELGAFCAAEDTAGTRMRLWLWEDVTQPPHELDLAEGPDVPLLGGNYPVAVRHPNGTLFGAAGYIQDPDYKIGVVLRVKEGSLRPEPIFDVSDATIEPIYSRQFPLGETGALLQVNPNVAAGEVVLMTNHAMTTRQGDTLWDQQWIIDDLPVSISDANHLYWLNHTWYVIPNDLTGDIWRLQLRNPNVVPD